MAHMSSVFNKLALVVITMSALHWETVEGYHTLTNYCTRVSACSSCSTYSISFADSSCGTYTSCYSCGPFGRRCCNSYPRTCLHYGSYCGQCAVGYRRTGNYYYDYGCAACSHYGSSYFCGSGYYRTGYICSGSTFSDTQYCGGCTGGPSWYCGVGNRRVGSACSGTSSSNSQGCTSCSTSCPSGQYISSPCTGYGTSDIGCTPCTSSCPAGQVPLGSCDGTSNSDVVQCVSAPTASPTTSSPTAAPTDSPTTSTPTSSPTNSPTTSSPTATPTDSPTTSSPTPAPTDSPTTSSPTDSPTTSSPTAAPTDSPTLSPTPACQATDATRVVLVDLPNDVCQLAAQGNSDALSQIAAWLGISPSEVEPCVTCAGSGRQRRQSQTLSDLTLYVPINALSYAEITAAISTITPDNPLAFTVTLPDGTAATVAIVAADALPGPTAPTPSPTTAAPTTPCSTFTQTFVITEVPTCSAFPTTGKGKGKGTPQTGPLSCPSRKSSDVSRDIGEALAAVYATSSVFGTVAFGDMIDDITVTSWGNASIGHWIHVVSFVFKPESPLNHVAMAQAGVAFEGTHAVSYCGCDVTVDVADSTWGYDIAEERATSASASKSASVSKTGSSCKHAYKAAASVAAPTVVSSTATSSVVVGVALACVVVVAAVAMSIRRRFRANSNNNEPAVAHNDSFEVHAF